MKKLVLLLSAVFIALGGCQIDGAGPDVSGEKATAMLTLPVIPPILGFTDDFDRPDSPEVGNGWIEKNPDAFSIRNGTVVKAGTALSYEDNVVYRPAEESLQDVEVILEFSILNPYAPGYPQVTARVQTDTVDLPRTLDEYLLYIPNQLDRAIVARQRGTDYVFTLVEFPLDASLDIETRYRLRLNVSGTSPVELIGAVERFESDAWQIIGQGNVEDSSPERIATGGSMGFAGSNTDGRYVYHSFSYAPVVDLGM